MRFPLVTASYGNWPDVLAGRVGCLRGCPGRARRICIPRLEPGNETRKVAAGLRAGEF